MPAHQADSALDPARTGEMFSRSLANDYVSGLVKRLMDIGIALSIVIFLLPAFILIAVAIKATSKGPVLFRQERFGLGPKAFSCFKFRTMTVWEDGTDQITQCRPGDERVTAVGRFLRRTSLDELPQFFNVIMGDMSIVGPRPHAVSHDRYFWTKVENYKLRFDVKPGITGLAQVSGLRGPTETIEVMAKRIEADCEYVRKASLLLDLKIIARTVPALLGAENAF